MLPATLLKSLIPASVKPALGALRRIAGGQRAVFPSDTPLLQYGNVDSHTNGEEFLIRAYASGWTRCFDVGANHGAYAAMVLGHNPACAVTSFEPNPALAAQMQAKAAALGDANWEVRGVAVGCASGSVTLNIDTACDEHSSLHRGGRGTQAVVVPSITLDDYCETNGVAFLDFCKIDTEGNEANVLRGAAALLAEQRIGMIQFEYGEHYKDAGSSLKEIYDLLCGNYTVFHLEPLGLLPLPYGQSMERFWYSNWVAISHQRLFGRRPAATDSSGEPASS